MTSFETVRRVKRTLLQAIAGGALTAFITQVIGASPSLALWAAPIATTLVSYAQNALEDMNKITDRR